MLQFKRSNRPVASLRLVSPGPAIEGVTPIFPEFTITKNTGETTLEGGEGASGELSFRVESG